MKEYKVLRQSDRFFRGTFDIDKLEEAINTYAKEGWIVITAVNSSIEAQIGFGRKNRDEIVVLMEREKTKEILEEKEPEKNKDKGLICSKCKEPIVDNLWFGDPDNKLCKACSDGTRTYK